jgi:hypothetical protein
MDPTDPDPDPNHFKKTMILTIEHCELFEEYCQHFHVDPANFWSNRLLTICKGCRTIFLQSSNNFFIFFRAELEFLSVFGTLLFKLRER